MMHPKVSIIIPNHMGNDVLSKCLRSLNQVAEYAEVVVSDDCSGENIEQLVQNAGVKLPVKIVRRFVNGGFAPAINSGVDVANGEYLVFFNNDARATEDWLTHLVAAIELDRKIGAVQSLILREDGSVDCYGGRIDELGFPHEIGKGSIAIQQKATQIIDYAKAASMLIRKEDYEKFGRFDNSFYLGYESVDLCWRMRNKGKVILFEPKSVAEHISRHASARVSKPKRWHHVTKNQLLTFMRNASDEQLLISTDLILAVRDEQIKRHLSQGYVDTAKGIEEGVLYALAHAEKYMGINENASLRSRLAVVDKLTNYTRGQK